MTPVTVSEISTSASWSQSTVTYDSAPALTGISASSTFTITSGTALTDGAVYTATAPAAIVVSFFAC